MINEIKSSQDLDALFLEFHKIIYNYIYARTSRREDADDIAQEVFFRAWKYRKSYNAKKSNCKTWLFTIAHNSLKDYYKKQSNNSTTPLEEEIYDTLPGTTDIAAEISEKMESEKIWQQVKGLNPREQNPLTLRYQQDLPIKEISTILGMEYSTAKVALHRTLKKLQQVMLKNH